MKATSVPRLIVPSSSRTPPYQRITPVVTALKISTVGSNTAYQKRMRRLASSAPRLRLSKRRMFSRWRLKSCTTATPVIISFR